MKKKKWNGKLGAGALCFSMGQAVWFPFVITETLGGARTSWLAAVLGMFLMAAGIVLLLRGLAAGNWREWLKLAALYAGLQLCLSVLTGALAVLLLEWSGKDAAFAKRAVDWISAVLAVPFHSWMLCILGRLCVEGSCVLWIPGRLFCRLLFLCVFSACVQQGLSFLPYGSVCVTVQGIAGGVLLWLLLWLTCDWTRQELESMTEEGR